MVATLLPFFIASCSTGASDPEVPGSSPAPSASSSTIASADDPLDNGGYSEFTWDDFVQSQKEVSGLTTWPEVDRIRFVSQEDWPTEQAQCLSAQGFPTTVGSDGSYTTKGVSEQQQAFDEASYVCALQYPMDLKYAQAYSRTQLRAIYAHYRDSLVPCLQGLGFEPGSLPSEETFVEGIASGSSSWTPYDALNLSHNSVQKMNDSCPGTPPEEVLYAG